ncbi:DUF488 family protein [Tissierella sp. Yu-01]|uniref:DUF488 domain-containing protein n=1 Tax=Tissierella sp. Yu-01 TaxID=3035694 RepID=UPI00240CFF4E|nr:DUF488 family protein [Tissierella sp. Yu-01]WFA09910.1 DUF488 family protein [Tissierella sp. Yu-01]
MLSIKRIYEGPDLEDGYRVLVDKLWPRGISKERAKLDYWAKGITPSTELRKYFCHDADKFEEFSKGYIFELDNNEASVEFINLIKDKLNEGNVTLIYAAKDPHINHAKVLKEWIEQKL